MMAHASNYLAIGQFCRQMKDVLCVLLAHMFVKCNVEPSKKFLSAGGKYDIGIWNLGSKSYEYRVVTP